MHPTLDATYPLFVFPARAGIHAKQGTGLRRYGVNDLAVFAVFAVFAANDQPSTSRFPQKSCATDGWGPK